MDKEMMSSGPSTPGNILFKTDRCSPLVVYFIYVIMAGVSLYNNYNNSKKINNNKVKNTINMHLWYEIIFIIVLGVLLAGLCQYDHENIAWALLFLPLVLILIKVSFVFSSVSTILKHTPGDTPMALSNKTTENLISTINSSAAQETPINVKQAYEQKQMASNQPEMNPPLVPSGFNL